MSTDKHDRVAAELSKLLGVGEHDPGYGPDPIAALLRKRYEPFVREDFWWLPMSQWTDAEIDAQRDEDFGPNGDASTPGFLRMSSALQGMAAGAIEASRELNSAKLEELKTEIKAILLEAGDRLCWRDVYSKLAGMVGIDFKPDMLPREVMLTNCAAFIDSLQTGEYNPAPVYILMDNAGRVAGVWDHLPTESECTQSYSAYLGQDVDAQCTAWNTWIEVHLPNKVWSKPATVVPADCQHGMP